MRYAIAAYMLTATAALAHSGHAEADALGQAHWLLQPDHQAVVALGLLVAVLLARRGARRPPQKKKT